MSAFVVDASALVYALTSTAEPAGALRRRLRDGQCHAPHLLDAEVGSVARRMVLRGDLPTADGLAVVEAAGQVVDHWYAHGPLARLAWSLRETVSYYDALYVAVAVALDLPLVTCDARLAAAPGPPCAVEVLPGPAAPSARSASLTRQAPASATPS